MHRTEGANNDGNLFKDGPPGTTVGAAILNAIQEEICNVIEESGIAVKTQSTETRDQLAKAISDFVDKTKYAVDNEATDAYVITRSPAPSVLYDGMIVAFKANTANTGPATLNDTGLGAKALKKNYDEDVADDDIEAGQIVTVRYDITNDWYQIQNPKGDRIVSTTKMWFYQNTAPAGWTIDAVPADAILAVKGGADAYNVNGGNQAGTWTQPNHLHTTGDHACTVLQMPSHVHACNEAVTGAGAAAFAVNTNPSGTINTESKGGDNAHNHGNTGNAATAATYRPLAQVGIICTKD